MAKRRRRTLEERIVAAEEQLAALRTKRLAQKEPFEQRIPAILARRERRDQRNDQRKAAWERLSVAAKVKHKRRDLGKLVAEWETRDEQLAQYAGRRVPYHVHFRLGEGHYWNRRLNIEADIAELEGASPEQLARLRWAADETFRRGKPVSPDEYKPYVPPPPVPVAVPDAALDVHQPRERRPKPPERDVLRDYRGNADYQRHRRLEPEFT